MSSELGEIVIHDASESNEDSGDIEEGLGEITDILFDYAMRWDWDNIIQLYKAKPKARLAKITRSEDTVLHLAAMEGAEHAVRKLINALNDGEAEKVLMARNDRGNTALHIAAALGNEDICKLLASRCPGVIMNARNGKGRTPLFLAVDCNQKNVFLLMHSLVKTKLNPSPNEVITSSRSKGGETILHRAIFGEYYELANEILQHYPYLANCVNEHGQYALHILAEKPDSFRSGGTLGIIDSIIYAGTTTEPLMVDYPIQDLHGEFSSKLPKNYKSCLMVYSMITKCFKFAKHGEEKIALTVNTQDHTEQDNDGKKKPLMPPIYATGVLFCKIIIKICLVMLGYGITRVENIRKKKKKHNEAKQVMNELIKNISLYKRAFHEGEKPMDTSDILADMKTEPITDTMIKPEKKIRRRRQNKERRKEGRK